MTFNIFDGKLTAVSFSYAVPTKRDNPLKKVELSEWYCYHHFTAKQQQKVTGIAQHVTISNTLSTYTHVHTVLWETNFSADS